MDKRIEIGILYQYTPNWMGGVYYIQNLITSLNLLDDKDKPIINVYCNSQDRFNELATATKYPYLNYLYYVNNHKILIDYVADRVHKYTLIPLNKHNVINAGNRSNILFYPTRWGINSDKNKTLAWIPDFQEHYLPQLFNKKEMLTRKYLYQLYVEKQTPIVFSSEDAQSDFKRFYPEAKNKTFVLRFATFHPNIDDISFDYLKEKYSISGDYVFCANQFWIHKNHLFLFKAFKQAKDRGFNKKLLCSGALKDKRDDSYAQEIIQFLKENHLEDDIKILGFIDRKDQLALMKYSYAIVQPSLFEGWSTVVEDAKALNKFIFLSNLNVHIEQSPANVVYFDPHDVNDLSTKLLEVTPTQNPYDYSINQKDVANQFHKIIKYFQGIES